MSPRTFPCTIPPGGGGVTHREHWWSRRRAPRRGLRALLALATLAAPAAALAYLPPATALLARAAQRRVETRLPGIEVAGQLALQGEAAAQLSAALGLPAVGAELVLPALVQVKGPGRCRLQVQASAPGPVGGGVASPPPGTARPAYSMRSGRPGGQRGLESVAPVRAMVEGVCVLLGDGGGAAPEVERALAQRLVGYGVVLGEVALGRTGTRVGWVIGGRPAPREKEPPPEPIPSFPQSLARGPNPPPGATAPAQATAARAQPLPAQPPPAPFPPQVWLDKETFQPMRLVATLAGAPRDVRLLDFEIVPGTDAFPRAVEVWSAGAREARFTAERVSPSPKLPDALF